MEDATCEAPLGCLGVTRDGVVLRVRVQPRSSKTELAGMAGEFLRVRVNAAPVEGAANKACCVLLAKLFGIARGRVDVIAGTRSREKQILLRGVDAESALSRLSNLLHES
jgi:uncharacterized protein (TIGR00251 family)